MRPRTIDSRSSRVSLLCCASLAAGVLLTGACTTTVRNFGGGGGGGDAGGGDAGGGDAGGGDAGGGGPTSSTSSSGGGGCAPPLTACGGGCTDTRLDPANCGSCGDACTAGPNAVPTCADAVCGFKCDGIHEDCNALADDGCEADVTRDPAHCGGCDIACPEGRNGVTVCERGACGVVCDAGFSNCAGTVPGCETDTRSDPFNCGGCGVPCGRGFRCVGGACAPPGLSGATGDAWEAVPGSMMGGRGLQEYVPGGSRYMYVGSGSTFQRQDLLTGAWERLPTPPVSLAGWGSPAFSGGYVWELRAVNIVRFDPSSNAWATVRADLHEGDQEAMTTADGAGHLWSLNAAKELVEYDPFADVVIYHPTGIMSDTFEARVGWDGVSNSIYFGGFATPVLNRYDIATGLVTQVAPHPEPYLNDIFCTDRSGHIYTAGDGMGTTIWQYDVARNTWRRIPDFPVDHGNNGSCGVHQDGWLYVETGDVGANVFRIRLL